MTICVMIINNIVKVIEFTGMFNLDGKYHNTATASVLPPNTVPGVTPKLILTTEFKVEAVWYVILPFPLSPLSCSIHNSVEMYKYRPSR